MREIWVRNVAILTGVLLTALSVVFACSQNADVQRGDREAPPAGAAADDAGRAEPGRALYVAQGCANCHSIAGQGNPRFPLDGIGSRRSASEIHDWMLGTGPAATRLTGRSLQAKERYRSLSEEDLQALVRYLQGLPRQ